MEEFSESTSEDFIESSETSSEYEISSEISSENYPAHESNSESQSGYIAETVVDYSEQIQQINTRLDLIVTFLTIFAFAVFIYWIWNIFYKWFYKSV